MSKAHTTEPGRDDGAGGRAEPRVSRSFDDVKCILKMHGFGEYENDDMVLIAITDICTRLRILSAAADAFVRTARKQGIVGD
jgi:hypothetical protein